MTTFFTSDLHIGDKRVLKFRPFSDLRDMKETLVRKWNARVTMADTVYVLGDFFIGTMKAQLQFMGKLNGHLRFIMGNHDGTFNRQKSLEMWESVTSARDFTLNNGRVARLVHNPKQEEFDAMRAWCGNDFVILHGHFHSPELFRKTGPRSLDVGVDAWNFEPVSEEEVCNELSRN